MDVQTHFETTSSNDEILPLTNYTYLGVTVKDIQTYVLKTCD